MLILSKTKCGQKITKKSIHFIKRSQNLWENHKKCKLWWKIRKIWKFCRKIIKNMQILLNDHKNMQISSNDHKNMQTPMKDCKKYASFVQRSWKIRFYWRKIQFLLLQNGFQALSSLIHICVIYTFVCIYSIYIFVYI